MMKAIYESYSERETRNIGKEIAKESKIGDIYCLDGELGVGKTVFSKGFGEGLGIKEIITSPTFTLINVYTSGRFHFYHFDMYRISDSYELDEIGYEEYFYGEGVTMIEWAKNVVEVLPKTAKYITIEKDLEKDFDYRKIYVMDGE